MECLFCTELLLWDLGVLSCGHVFHDLCLIKYKNSYSNNLKHHNVIPCPICRVSFQNWTFAYLKFAIDPSHNADEDYHENLKIKEMEHQNEKLKHQIKALKDNIIKQEQQIIKFIQSKRNNSKFSNFIGRLFCIK